MVEGPSVDLHHWIPRSRGGRESSPLHKICHRMIHRLFTERELASDFAAPEAIRAHPDMERFIAWVRKRPPEYVAWPKKPRR